jgi:hypothetical protein
MLKDDKGGTWGQGGPQQQFLPAHEAFRASLQGAWVSQEAEQAVNIAFAAYAAIAQEPWQSADLSKRLAEAYALCRKSVHEAFAVQGADRVLESYRQYVRDLKSVWADLDPESLAPEDLGSIAQGMSWVASVTLEVSAARFPSGEPRG